MKTAWKIVLGIIVVILIVAGGFWWWLNYEGSTKDMEAVANKFQAPSSWTETANDVVGVRNVCLEANCPSVFRSWKVPYAVTKAELASILKKASWDFPIEGECDVSSGGNGTGTTICETNGAVGTYHIALWVDGAADHPESTDVILKVKE